MSTKNQIIKGIESAVNGTPILISKEGSKGLMYDVVLQEVVKDEHYEVYEIHLCGRTAASAYFQTSVIAEGNKDYCMGIMDGKYGGTTEITGYKEKYFQSIKSGVYDGKVIHFKRHQKMIKRIQAV